MTTELDLTELDTSSKGLLNKNSSNSKVTKKNVRKEKLKSIQVYISSDEVTALEKEWSNSGITTFSAFVRWRMKQSNII